MRPIRLVTFDALHTIITPRKPIHIQYSEVFEPFVGALPPDRIKQSFKVALKAVQKEHPLYDQGARNWWQDVIRRTALESGAHQQALDANLGIIVNKLMHRFSSREGYAAFDDAIPTVNRLHECGVHTAIISNGDSRLHLVLKDLGLPSFMDPIILSEEVGMEKPSRDIFCRTLRLVNEKLGSTELRIEPKECLHVGDELDCDYKGAVEAGFEAVLLRRPGPSGEHERKEADENIEGVKVVEELRRVVESVKQSRA